MRLTAGRRSPTSIQPCALEAASDRSEVAKKRCSRRSPLTPREQVPNAPSAPASYRDRVTFDVAVSDNIKPIEVHHLVPRRHEVAHELLPRIVAGIDLRERTQLGVRTEEEIDAAAGPLLRCGGAATTFEPVRGVGGRLPLHVHVQQVDEEVVAQ